MEAATSLNRLELLQIADAVAREKSIEKDIVLGAMEEAVQKAARKVERERRKAAKAAGGTETLLPAAETIAPAPQHATIAAPERDEEKEERKSYDADSVFARLKDVKIEEDDEE